MRRPPASDPFRALGLEPRADLSDDDVRARWRRVAAATHPDRADGGDPAAFAAAAAAYTALRTRTGRGEALADLLAGQAGDVRRSALAAALASLTGPALPLLAVRIRRGRPAHLGLRVVTVALVGAVSVATAGWQPATWAILTGMLTWLVLTGRADLAPPPR